MASPRKTPWHTWQRFAENLVFRDTPRFLHMLQSSTAVQRGIQLGLEIGFDLVNGGLPEPRKAIPAGRPVADTSTPTDRRARRLVYAPDLAGRADPGEVVWAWVPHDDDPGRGRDRAVLVVGRDRDTLLALLLAAPDDRVVEPDWVGIGAGDWADPGRPAWVRLDRVFNVPEEGIRRQGAVLDRAAFDVVATRLRLDYSWS